MRETATANKTLQTGALRAVGLVSFEGTRARVLVVGDALLTWDESGKAPQERFYRWTMEVTKTRGAWLVSKAELVP
jgi:Mce-associated membrane protein